MTDAIVMTVLATLVLSVRLIRDLRATAVEAGVERWSQRYGLSITDDVHDWLLRRRRSTSLGFALGLWAGMVVGGLLTVLPTAQPWSLQGGFLVQAGWWVAGGVGAVLGGALGARLTPASAPRVARNRAVTLADYAGPVERVLPLIAAIAGLCAGVVPLVEGARGTDATAPLAAALGSTAVLGIALVVTRIAVGRPQRASGTHLLAWSDALRSEIIRTTLESAALVAAASLVVSIPAALRASGSPIRSSDATLWTTLALVALVAGFWIRSVRVQPERHFLRRLWPVTAAELAEHERPLEEAAR